MPTPRGVVLTPAYSTYADTVTGFRLAVTASAANAMPAEVFAYRLEPLAPATVGDPVQAPRGIFSHVCSPSDLEEYPVGAPYPNSSPPWFRLPTLDLVFRSRSLADAAWAEVQVEVLGLVAALGALDDLTAMAPVPIGTPTGS